MFTSKRLDSIYRKAERINIDNHSQFVFISDVHRGDNSVSDEFAQNKLVYYHALEYYFENGYTYVEAGDGDEMWEVPSYRYIASSHPGVFGELRKFQKAGRFIMLAGNHNHQILKPEYVKKYMEYDYDAFLDETVEVLPGVKPKEAVVLVYEPTGQEILVYHGQAGEILNDYLAPVGMVTNRYIWRFIHKAGFHYSANPTKNRYKPAHREKALKKWIDDNNMILICGHTHRPRLPVKGEIPYFNSGCVMHPHGMTCLELAFGEISLVRWTIHTRKDGMLYIKRATMKGPVNIEDFKK
ncbi:MAG: metallophosphoesterase family protein [Anaerovoracaceae bacterium]|nr:metallophosphoesterase family protein [Bacillota bacterium]MDY2671041.1 metallophosphoesterase family protein [Anaerovoracaceae bacterium]